MELFYCFKELPNIKCDIDFLQKALYSRLEGNSETTLDEITHLMLCLLAINYPALKNNIFRVETEIFKKRLLNIDISNFKHHIVDVCYTIKSIISKRHFSGPSYKRLELSVKILQAIEARIEHVFDKSHNVQCKHTKLIIPFIYPLSLLSERKVELHFGKADVHCGLWPELLVDVYRHLLELKLKICPNLKLASDTLNLAEDGRLRKLLRNCAARLGVDNNTNLPFLTLQSVDAESKYFPPCMANLHQILRKTHRLSYDSRYQYSLFLKDAGLNIEDNINFWKKEYSLPHNNSNCTHHWDDKENRYIYQLKHMYGLIGGAQVKYSRSCHVFIDNLSYKMNDGCPFKHLNSKDLSLALPRQIQNSSSQILKYQAADEPRRACSYFLELQRGVPGPTEIVRPIQYYMLARNIRRCDSVIIVDPHIFGVTKINHLHINNNQFQLLFF